MNSIHPTKQLGRVASITMGQSPSSDFVHDGLVKGLPFLQGCAEFGASVPVATKSCSGTGKRAQTNSSLISVRAPVGALNLADRDYVIGRGLAAVYANSGVDQKFLAYSLQHSARSLWRVSQGSTFEAIGGKELRELEVPIPVDVREQRRIAELLSTLDEQIEQTEAYLQKVELENRGVANKLLSCEAFALDQVDSVLLSEVIPTIQYGISSSLTEAGVVPVLRMNNLHRGEINVSDLKYSPVAVPDSLLLKDGDVLFNRTNSMEHVGRTSIWRGQLTKATFASYLVRLNPNPKRLLAAYLVYLLEWEENQIQMRKFATPGVQQVNINPTSLRRCRVQIPKSLVVQQDIIDALEAARKFKAGLRIELAKLLGLRQGLMQDLLAGKVRLPC